jgi:hypothetical protein
MVAWLQPSSHAQGQVQVTAADPFAAEQGTIDLVKITGKDSRTARRQNGCHHHEEYRRPL